MKSSNSFWSDHRFWFDQQITNCFSYLEKPQNHKKIIKVILITAVVFIILYYFGNVLQVNTEAGRMAPIPGD